MKNYVEVAYKEKEKPFGEYPLQLAAYLMKQYGLKKGMSILDNGCGRGEFLHAFSYFGMEAVGTDISNYCRNVEIVDLNKGRLPFSNNYFDVVFSKSVIEHVTDLEHYMDEMKRVLKKGGLLILMTPDWETQYKIFYRDPTHVHPYTVKAIERLLEMYDFKSVRVQRFIQLPCTWDDIFMEALSKLVRKMGPVDRIYKNKFIRFSRELMILGSGKK